MWCLQYVEPQRKVANLIVPRGIENRVALGRIPSLSLQIDGTDCDC